MELEGVFLRAVFPWFSVISTEAVIRPMAVLPSKWLASLTVKFISCLLDQKLCVSKFRASSHSVRGKEGLLFLVHKSSKPDNNEAESGRAS